MKLLRIFFIIAIAFGFITPLAHAQIDMTNAAYGNQSADTRFATDASQKATVSPKASATSITSKTPTAVSDGDITKANKDAETAAKSYKSAKTADKLKRGQDLVARIVDVRIKTLQNFNNRDFTGLTNSQITSLKSVTQEAIDALTSIATKVATETSLDGVKADAASVYSNRVFEILMPKVQATQAVYQAQAVLSVLQGLIPQLQKRITDLTTAGKDTAALKISLTDYQAKLVDAQTQITSANTNLNKITASDITASQTLLKQTRDDLKVIRADFVAARGDLKTYKDLSTGSKATTSSPSSTPSAASKTKASTD